MKPSRRTLLFAVAAAYGLALVLPAARAQTIPPELGQGWLPEFTLTSRQLLQLAEATPADKFSWRPGPGVRSISEVYMHLAIGNYFLMQRAGVTPPIDLSTLPKDPEKSVTSKADVIKWLRESLDAVSKGYQSADRQKKVQLFNKDTTAASSCASSFTTTNTWASRSRTRG